MQIAKWVLFVFFVFKLFDLIIIVCRVKTNQIVLTLHYTEEIDDCLIPKPNSIFKFAISDTNTFYLIVLLKQLMATKVGSMRWPMNFHWLLFDRILMNQSHFSRFDDLDFMFSFHFFSTVTFLSRQNLTLQNIFFCCTIYFFSFWEYFGPFFFQTSFIDCKEKKTRIFFFSTSKTKL